MARLPTNKLPRTVKSGKPGGRIKQRKQDLRQWYHTIDWAEWWEDFFLSVGKDGKPKYKTTTQFIKAKAKTVEQYDFLVWYLGPTKDEDRPDDPRHEKYRYIAPEPVGWYNKRNTGGWYHETSLRVLRTEISRRMVGLEALRETGNRWGINFLMRAEKLAQKIDKFFMGEPFLPDLSPEENLKRAKTYIGLQHQMMEFYNSAQDMYARSHGINFDDMSGLMRIMEASVMASAQQQVEGKVITPQQAAVQAFAEVALAKAGKYSGVARLMPPDVIDAVAEKVTDAQETAEKQKKVQ